MNLQQQKERPMKHEASCSCGQLTLHYEGDIVRSSICHCFACQKRTGSAFGNQARLEREKVNVQGKATKYERTPDDGGSVVFHFCPVCGSTVFWEIDDLPDWVIVAVGAFANPNFPAPTFSVYEARKYPWVEIPKSVVERWD